MVVLSRQKIINGERIDVIPQSTHKAWAEPKEDSMSNRLNQWKSFNRRMEDHIEVYTVPQYGDYPNDQMTTFTPEEIQMNMKRYLNRVGRDQRGIENSLMDCLKLAHYACELYYKTRGEER